MVSFKVAVLLFSVFKAVAGEYYGGEGSVGLIIGLLVWGGVTVFYVVVITCSCVCRRKRYARLESQRLDPTSVSTVDQSRHQEGDIGNNQLQGTQRFVQPPTALHMEQQTSWLNTVSETSVIQDPTVPVLPYMYPNY